MQRTRGNMPWPIVSPAAVVGVAGREGREHWRRRKVGGSHVHRVHVIAHGHLHRVRVEVGHELVFARRRSRGLGSNGGHAGDHSTVRVVRGVDLMRERLAARHVLVVHLRGVRQLIPRLVVHGVADLRLRGADGELSPLSHLLLRRATAAHVGLHHVLLHRVGLELVAGVHALVLERHHRVTLPVSRGLRRLGHAGPRVSVKVVGVAALVAALARVLLDLHLVLLGV
mmetsp:Transcript_10279/g.21672  ORF Transcript_10279/g.21672 Transcript_10279/m.21672 type:complete len:227 (+) Transcript_10279:519-1199(+)